MEKKDILNEMVDTLEAINEMIDETKLLAQENQIEPLKMRTTTGQLMLTPLLTAKAELLIALFHFTEDFLSQRKHG